MNLADIVFVLSVQHTGTWFLLKFLENFIPGRDAIRDAMLEGKVPGARTVLHAHFPVTRALEELLPQEQYNSLPVEGIRAICLFLKTIIPVRDPLASILTRESRRPELRHFYIVDGFKQLAQLEGHENIKFFPVDLYKDSEQRELLLSETLSHCGIDPSEHTERIHVVAKEWLHENITPRNRFREAYDDKDIDKIRFLLGPKWAEVEYLHRSATFILPFLNRLGYDNKEHLSLWL